MTRIAALIFMILALTAGANAVSTGEAIATAIVDLYHLDRNIYEIEILGNSLKTADVLPNELSVRPMTQKDPLGLFSVKAIIKINGKQVETAQVRTKIKKFMDVLVMTDDVRRNTEFHSELVAVRRMDVTNLREVPLTSVDELTGLRARRNLRSGLILTTAALETIPDVESGKQVSIVYADGLCKITAPGTVMQRGSAGDYIRVKNRASNKIIIARIVDSTVVAVDP